MNTPNAYISTVLDRCAGAWVPCDDEDEFNKGFDAIKARWPSEEYIISDIEHLPASLSESFPESALWVGLLAVELDGGCPWALLEHVREQGWTGDDGDSLTRWPRSESEVESFCETVRDGVRSFESYEDYGRDDYESHCGDVPPALEDHIDWEGYGRSLLIDHEVFSSLGTHYYYVNPGY
jgi:antirestriction protein